MSMSTSLVLFRRDLRMADNPALIQAVQAGNPLICLYIWDPEMSAIEKPGQASQWWLHHSLHNLKQDIQKAGNRLITHSGPYLETAKTFIRQHHVTKIFWNQTWDPSSLTEEQQLHRWSLDQGLQVHPSNGNYLLDPREFSNTSGKPYTVFTPFWNRLQKTVRQRKPLRAPRRLPGSPNLPNVKEENVLPFFIKSLPKKRQEGYAQYWKPGEAGAHHRVASFVRKKAESYQTDRDRPDLLGTSRLSPHLHYGELSPWQVWNYLERRAHYGTRSMKASFLSYKRQIAWREFSQHLLFHFPHLTQRPLQAHYAKFPWKSRHEWLKAWQKGETGYPLIDAGMRELWHTGWMHNRVRMVVASFLTKHLLLPWQEGAAWFWDNLMDADLGNNTFGWQWAAGCGADAAPFFRIFNPIIQGKKFDSKGTYVRRWVPELRDLPTRFIHQPWDAPQTELKKAKIALGQHYPFPLVDHQTARERALHLFQEFQRSRNPNGEKAGNSKPVQARARREYANE